MTDNQLPIKISEKLVVDDEFHFSRIDFESGGRTKKSVYLRDDFLIGKEIVQYLVSRGMQTTGHKTEKISALIAKLFHEFNSTHYKVRHATTFPQYSKNLLITHAGYYGRREKGELYAFVKNFDDKKQIIKPEQLVRYTAKKSDAEVSRKQFGILMEQSTPLTLAYLAAHFAPLLMKRKHWELNSMLGFALILSGDGGGGKTTLQGSIYSLSHEFSSEGDFLSFNMTPGKLSKELPAHCGVINPIADFKAGFEKDRKLLDRIQTLIFSAVNGIARKSLRDDYKLDFVCPQVLLVAMELSLLEAANKQSIVLQKGDIRRVVDLHIPSPKDGGIFDLRKEQDTSDFAEQLENLSYENNRGIFQDWIRYVFPLKTIEVQKLWKESRKSQWCEDQKERKQLSRLRANYDQLWFTALLMKKLNLLPTKIAHVRACLNRAYTLSKSSQNMPPSSQQVFKQQLAKLLRDRRLFPTEKNLKSGQARNSGILGFIQKHKDGWQVLIHGQSLKGHMNDFEPNKIDDVVHSLIDCHFGYKQNYGEYSVQRMKDFFPEQWASRTRFWCLHVNKKRELVIRRS